MGKKTEAMPEAEEPEISDYELVRLENIRRNDARLGLLGLGGAKSVQAQLSSTGRLKRRCRPAHTGPVRSSGRERKRSTRLPVDSPTDARRASGASRPKNAAPLSVSGYRGVSSVRDKWQAYIYLPGGKKQHIGSYATKELAARAYDSVAWELKGERAQLNFGREETVARGALAGVVDAIVRQDHSAATLADTCQHTGSASRADATSAAATDAVEADLFVAGGSLGKEMEVNALLQLRQLSAVITV